MSAKAAQEGEGAAIPSPVRPLKKYSACRDFLDFIVLVFRIIGTYLKALLMCIVPASKKSLENEIVLITGAGRGLGRELALQFADKKATVVLWDIDEAAIYAVQSEILVKNQKAFAFVCDVSNEDEVNRVGKLVQEQVGDVSILINNAGILQNLPFMQLNPNRIRKTFDINILAHYWTIRCFLPNMLKNGKGHIAGVSSAGGLIGWLHMGDYGATKFAVVGLMEVLGEEMRRAGKDKEIHFTTICPFTIDTGINHNPTCRVPLLLPLLDVKKSAAEIILAIRRNERIITLPRRCLFPMYLSRIAPRRITQLVLDYMQYNVLPNNLEEVKVV